MGMREIIFQIRGGKSQEEWGFSENQGKCKLFFLICRITIHVLHIENIKSEIPL